MLLKKNRLESDFFKEVSSRKKSVSKTASSDFFTIKKYSDDKKISRFAVVVSTKVSNLSVERNRIKRIVYEFIRKNIELNKPNTAYVIITKPNTKKQKKEIIIQDLLNIFSKI